ncbi:MAG TPA: hypothetical protein ENG03_07845 [Thioploca sp.]|nr:MAG: hypothetical protein B6247_08005 [Beggiatoa sp. 4572_84]RKZ63970.1 MAG: hypothetical protein DRR08_02020 [Gammaproteobacteria bacterium]HDN26992.1 hypothetical protein [Thioploca sp.]
MKKKTPKNPKARNNSAHASLQSYFDRISHSLEDRLSEYVQMKKYVRVYEESKKLLDIEKTINIAAGSIYEINVDQKLDVNAMKPLMQSLDDKNKALKSYIKGKPQSLQLKLLSQVSKNIHIVNNHFPRINKHITRVNEVIPIIKALLKLPEKESNYENDPILIEISNALTVNIDEPSFANIRPLLEKEQIKLSQYDAKLQFEQMNDVSDKLIGLLNDKLLLIIGVSEFLIAGVEDDGANDVAAEQRLPDELRVLFLASSVLYIIYRIKEIRDSIKTIFNSIKLCLQIMNSDRLESQYKALLKNGNNSVYNILSNTTPKVLQRTKKAIIEIVPGLDALDLKLKLDTLDLETVMKMTYGLIYEKANRIWENPYE